jgi:hypothetical protein
MAQRFLRDVRDGNLAAVQRAINNPAAIRFKEPGVSLSQAFSQCCAPLPAGASPGPSAAGGRLSCGMQTSGMTLHGVTAVASEVRNAGNPLSGYANTLRQALH